jgi:PIN domain nuclease of toxin-antitoxin system
MLSGKMSDVLLDTHIFLWLLTGDTRLGGENLGIIERRVASGGRICLSAISIWEMAMLESKGRIQLTQSLDRWISKALELSSANVVELSSEILIDSCRLPGDFHADPADRMIVSTSRINNVPLITQDDKILNYISKGFCPRIEKC